MYLKNMGKLLKHLKTIHTHRKYVRQMCFKMGIPWQGLVHDLSKYSISELLMCKYWTGTCSPHATCRELFGYSPSWMHHYHVNKHHWQYWIDAEDWPDKFIAAKMPYKYVIEMCCDQIGASKAYNKDKFNVKMVWQYWVEKCEGKRLMHKESEYLIKKLLWMYSELGEDKFVSWYKANKKTLKTMYNDNVLSLENAYVIS